MGPRLRSRGIDEALPGALAAASASMGPRLRSRGILTHRTVSPTKIPLQWGRDFAVAESRCRPTRRPSATTLQWGRDFAVAESMSFSYSISARIIASMGPRLRSRGISRPRSRFATSSRASMGPRLRSRGIVNVIWWMISRRTLQWGRDFAVAESSKWYRYIRPAFMLQWGRDFAVAESGRLSLESFRSWTLQWGRDFAVAESSRDAGRDWPHRASMGPRLRSRGIAVRSEVSTVMAQCFNGAATSQSRNRGTDGAGAERRDASMGPRLRSRGICRSLPAAACRVRASMGPRLRSRGIAGRQILMLRKARLQWGRDFAVAESAAILTV